MTTLACPLMARPTDSAARRSLPRTSLCGRRRRLLSLCLFPFLSLGLGCRIDEPAPAKGRSSVATAPSDAAFLASASDGASIPAGFRNYAPHIVPGRAKVEGSLEGAAGVEELRRTVRRQMASLDHCYLDRLRVRPALRGRLVARFVIDPSGAPHDATVGEGSLPNLNDPQLQECVLGEIRRWKFPARPGQRPSTVAYPFVFEASD